MRRYLKLHVTLASNIKVSRLTDRAFRAYVMSLVSAKNQSPEGEWIDEASYRFALGDLADELPALMADDLLVTTPSGSLKVRQWRHWQMADRHLPAAVMPEDVLAKRRKSDRERQARRRATIRTKLSRSGHAPSRDVEHEPVTDVSRTTPPKGVNAERDHGSRIGVDRSAPSNPDRSVASLCVMCQKPIEGPSRTTSWDGKDGPAHVECLRVIGR